MTRTFYTRLIFLTILSLFFRLTWGQLSVENSWKIGENNTSQGTYLKTALSAYYQTENYAFNSQLQVDAINPQKRTLSGFLVNATRKTFSQKIPLSLSAQYLLLPFSTTLRESNFSLMAKGRAKGFSYTLGINFRTYAYTQQAVEDYNIEQQRLHENWGIIYQLGYTYISQREHWNVGLLLTNYDDFLINQDMNHFWRLKGQFKVSKKIQLYTECNYIKAGVFNSSSNYFGYYIKTGIIWHVN